MKGPEARAQILRACRVPGAPSSDFDLSSGVDLPPGRKLRPAAVLIGVRAHAGRAEVVLTKRSSRLKHHPGQIAFPGGKVDESDDGPVAAALREAEEEIGLPRRAVEVLGTMPPHETVTGFQVTPVLGWISERFDPLPEAGEVAEVFDVPLAHVTDPAQFIVEGRHWRGQRRNYYAVPWGPYYIWGATARMLRALADRMAV
ncbi:MAG: CoA pyrophosphatase [Pseudomonadota bacterium]